MNGLASFADFLETLYVEVMRLRNLPNVQSEIKEEVSIDKSHEE